MYLNIAIADSINGNSSNNESYEVGSNCHSFFFSSKNKKISR